MPKKIFSAFLCLTITFFTVTAAFSVSDYSTAEAAKVYETPYYYNQLTDKAKKVYKQLKEAVLNCDKTVKIDFDLHNDDNYEQYGQVTELLILHDPMAFNLENIEAKSYSGNSITFKLSYKYKKETYDKMVAAYEKETQEILDTFTEDMSTYKKIKAIHDYLIDNTVYDLETAGNDNIYGTLVKNIGKCDGYAKAFSYICGQAGIRTVTVIGEDKIDMDNSDYLHMWNKVYYNKKWYNVDVTWDDPVGNIKDNLSYDFFMVSDKALEKTHVEENLSFEVPAADDDSKDYYIKSKKYAETVDSAKSILKSGLTSAAKRGKTYAVVECSSKEVFDELKKYVSDTEQVSKLLTSVKKSSGSSLVTDVYSYNFNEYRNTVSIYIFYEDTDLSDYFLSADTLDSETLKTLGKFGIK